MPEAPPWHLQEQSGRVFCLADMCVDGSPDLHCLKMGRTRILGTSADVVIGAYRRRQPTTG